MKKIFFLLIFLSLFFFPVFAQASISYSVYARVEWASETCRTDYDLFVRTPTEGTCSPSSSTCEIYDAHRGCTANYWSPETFFRMSNYEGTWSFFYTMYCEACSPGNTPSCPEECTGDPDPVVAEVTIYAYTDILVNSTYMVLAGESISIPIDYVPLDSELFGTIVWVSDPLLPSPSPSPEPKCGGVTYDSVTQACCGDPTSVSARVYTKATEACCGPAEVGSFVFIKGGDEYCCTTKGDMKDEDNNGKFPELYDKKKRESCCVVDENTAPNICNGCKKCVTANKSYINVFAPECKGWGGRICVPIGSKTDVTKGQCIDDCQDCKRCSDASTVTDGTDGTIDRRPKLSDGSKQTEGLFCQKLEVMLTDEHYKTFPADQTPPTIDKTSYICQCAGQFTGCISSGSNKGGCFQYDETGYGYPPQPQYGIDNYCPITNTQPAKVKGSCWCVGSSRCGIGRKDANNYDVYVCADAGKTCAETKIEVGTVTVNYRLSSAGWTYDCGSKNCCVIDSATTSYCAGPWNMFCIKKTVQPGGKFCKTIQDCQTIPNVVGGGGGGFPFPPVDPPFGSFSTGCDEFGRCVSGGTLGSCDIANGDDDCASQTYCTDTKKCEIGGTHGACSSDADCLLTKCDNKRRCTTSGTLESCNLANGDEDCANQPGCDENEKCVLGGLLGPCPSVDSVGDDVCQKETRCNADRQCVAGGTLGSCDLANGNADCENQPGCDDYKKCVADGTRGWCPSIDSVGDTWCEPPEVLKFCDTTNLKCVKDGGDGDFCQSDDDCRKTCTTDRRCISGGGGIACTTDEECPGVYPSASNLRVDPIYCSDLAIFKWNYYHPEGKPQVQYQLQMSTMQNDPSTSENEFENNILFNTGFAQGETTQILVPVYLVSSRAPGVCSPFQSCNGFINFNVSYYWRVKVWSADNNGFLVGSAWTDYKDTHTFIPPDNYDDEFNDATHVNGFGLKGATSYADDKDANVDAYEYPYEHPYPRVVYDPPAIALPNQPAIFTDKSYCYHYNADDGSTVSYSCKNLIPPGSPPTDCKVPGRVCYECTAATDGRCYTWWHNGYDNNNPSNPAPTSYIIGNTSYTYTSKGTYQTKLKICDDIGCCSAEKDVNVSASSGSVVPQWWEITPYYNQ